jgi:two-component system alkaline phosphatase synthesis response regulator PhoP
VSSRARPGGRAVRQTGASVTEASDMPTILVADDEPDLLLLVSVRLRKLGYTVLTAGDGQEALDLIAEHSPQMAVLDIMMPRATGTEVLDRVRSDPATENMLVILMSAGFVAETDSEGIPTGADDFLHKPFRSGEMSDRVTALFARGARG